MNAERLRQVADIIELEDRFNYTRFTTGTGQSDYCENGVIPSTSMRAIPGLKSCGTTGCIAGWAALLAWEENPNISPNADIASVAEKWLGLTEEQACDLFYGAAGSEWLRNRDQNAEWADWRNISSIEAAKMLRQIADGEYVL